MEVSTVFPCLFAQCNTNPEPNKLPEFIYLIIFGMVTLVLGLLIFACFIIRCFCSSKCCTSPMIMRDRTPSIFSHNGPILNHNFEDFEGVHVISLAVYPINLTNKDKPPPSYDELFDQEIPKYDEIFSAQ